MSPVVSSVALLLDSPPASAIPGPCSESANEAASLVWQASAASPKSVDNVASVPAAQVGNFAVLHAAHLPQRVCFVT